MAAVMPMRYGSGAGAAAGCAATSVSTPTAALRMRPRMSALLLVPCQGGHLGGDPPLFVGREHRLDQVVVALEHQPALDLARGRDGLALLLGIQLARQHTEGLHLLHATEGRVRARDLRVEQARHLRVRGQRRVPGVREPTLARPLGDRFVIHLDQRGEVLAALAKDDGVADVGARAQARLDLRRADVLAAGGDHEVLPPVDEAEGTLGGPLRGVAPEEPAVAGRRRRRPRGAAGAPRENRAPAPPPPPAGRAPAKPRRPPKPPPTPPRARRAPAKPWRPPITAPIPPRARRAPAKPWRPSITAPIPPRARRAPAKPWRPSIPPGLRA